ncbi:MAG TPA: PepSY-associated TM helix domain-containing protein [Rhodanobacter sp.]|nr:PepSY-associated TM helix domain-containing protein [Rhodanobacter sp.]
MGYFKQPQILRWRKTLFQVHLWIGTIIGLFIIAICVSGSVLVFEQDLLNDTPQLPNASTRGPASWDELVNSALSANPESTLANIDMRSANRRVVPVGLSSHGQTLVVYVDSLTNQVVKQENSGQKHWFVEKMLALHTELALGDNGALAIGIFGALLFVMAMLGIVLWWPGVRGWKRALRINFRGRLVGINFDLHRTFGFWCFVLVAMWGITGAYFIFPKPFESAIKVFSPMPSLGQLASDWKPGDPILSAGALIQRAQSLYPQDQLAYLFMDTQRPHGVVKVFMSPRPWVPMEQLEEVLALQPATGAVLSNTSSALWTGGERFSLAVYSVHFGDFGGLPLQVLWALLGLVPVVLVITGYAMWWNRTLKKQWAKLAGRKPATPRTRGLDAALPPD